MDYRAVLTLDYVTPTDGNDNARLLNALEQAGWTYAETTAMYLECSDLRPILLGLEVLARGLDGPGAISALNFQVQLIGPDRRPPAWPNHRQALANILKRPLPSVDT
jgi:hypothetical protein